MSSGRRTEKLEPGDDSAEKAMRDVQSWARQTVAFLLSGREVAMGTAKGDEQKRAQALEAAVEQNVTVMWSDAAKNTTDLPSTINRFAMIVLRTVSEKFMDAEAPEAEFAALRAKNWSVETMFHLLDVEAQNAGEAVTSETMSSMNQEAQQRAGRLWEAAKGQMKTGELEELVVRFTRKVLQEVERLGPIPDPKFSKGD